MSFSKDVKNYLLTTHNETWSCCKEAFEEASKGNTYEFKCKHCANQYIAGIFYGYGTMSEPSKSFQLFIYPPSQTEELIHSVLKESNPPQKGKNRGKTCFYYKSCEGVGGFLAFCKATSFAMKIFEKSVEKQERGRIQRECNAEVANMARAAAAAEEQLWAIKLLKKYNMLDSLKIELYEAAQLRESNPEAGLSELVALSPSPVSKSGLNYRLKKLVELAKEIKNKNI